MGELVYPAVSKTAAHAYEFDSRRPHDMIKLAEPMQDWHPEQPNLTEIAAQAIYKARYEESFEIINKYLLRWDELEEYERDDFRQEAFAALQAVENKLNT